MASVKVILRKEKKSDGLFPLAIRITNDRKSRYGDAAAATRQKIAF